jgi:purine-nucleoside/S-methyl-5'-thioadenosine phosphorylase / adenosine deaminase
VIRWAQQGYVVAFTTRAGGVSEGPYASLNLGRLTLDPPENVDENRRRACAELDTSVDDLAFNRQVHSTAVHHATAGERGREGDGLWTDEPRVPLLAFAADCVPIAVARTGGARALAVLHGGWRGLADGIVAAGVRALGGAPAAAVVGPAIGPCCYEVGPEVSERFDRDLTRDGRLDLWAAAERELRAAGVATVERVDLCTACHPELFFSHRRDRGVTGRQGVIGYVA